MSIADQDRGGAATYPDWAGVGRRRHETPAAGWPGGVRWLLRRESMVSVLLVVAMVSVVWGSIGLHLRQQRVQAYARAEQESGNLAQAAAASIGETIASVDDALRFMRAIYMADPKHFDIAAWTNRANQTRETALEFTLIDRDGKLLASSLAPAATAGDFSHEDFFKSSIAETQDRLLIGQPIAGRTQGRWSLPFTRRITAADGWLIGVIVAAVDPSWLTRLHRSLETGRDALMLVGADGGIRALALGSAPDSTRGIGTHIDMTTLLGTTEHADRGTLGWVNPVDGTDQIVSYQRLAEDGSYVVVGLDTAEILAPYRLYARQYELFGAGITLLILIAGALLLNNTRRLLKSRQMLRDSVDAISQGIVMVDGDGRMPVINRRAGEMLQITDGAAPARPPDIALLPPPDGEADRTYEQTRADGTVLEISTHPLAGGAVVRTYADITERKRAEALILHLAMHDSLTGLPNRRLLTDRLGEEIAKSRAGGGGGAVLLVDLDRFKTINDARGHAFGDRVLGLAADRLRGLVRGADLAARIGGDEFCILQPGRDEPAALAAWAAKLMQQLSEPVHIADQEVLLSVSIGIACYPHDGASVDQLLTKADIALFRAKEGGRATFRLYEPEMDARIAERRQMEHDLRDAMTLDQLSVFYQPIVNAETRETAGFEALMRWSHPTRGQVPPGDFISVAEDSGLMGPLGFWVLAAACAEAATWPSPLRVSVNLSPRQFWRSDFAERVAAILAETGLPARRLVLEVTEGVLIDNRERALVAMTALSDLGIRIALDDFGTGYSSLSYLHQFPFDSIKIDRSFITTLCEDENSQAIVRAILTLGRSLHLKVVAEGVETEAQLRWLRAEGCVEVQGYLLGRPVPASQIRLSGVPVADSTT